MDPPKSLWFSLRNIESTFSGYLEWKRVKSQKEDCCWIFPFLFVKNLLFCGSLSPTYFVRQFHHFTSIYSIKRLKAITCMSKLYNTYLHRRKWNHSYSKNRSDTETVNSTVSLILCISILIPCLRWNLLTFFWSTDLQSRRRIKRDQECWWCRPHLIKSEIARNKVEVFRICG